MSTVCLTDMETTSPAVLAENKQREHSNTHAETEVLTWNFALWKPNLLQNVLTWIQKVLILLIFVEFVMVNLLNCPRIMRWINPTVHVLCLKCVCCQILIQAILCILLWKIQNQRDMNTINFLQVLSANVWIQKKGLVFPKEGKIKVWGANHRKKETYILAWSCHQNLTVCPETESCCPKKCWSVCALVSGFKLITFCLFFFTCLVGTLFLFKVLL